MRYFGSMPTGAARFHYDLSPDRSPLRIRSRTLTCFPTDRLLGESRFVIIRSSVRRDQSSVLLLRRLIAVHTVTALSYFAEGMCDEVCGVS